MYKLTIDNVQMEHAGTYTCYGKDENMFRFEDSGILTVTGGYIIATILYQNANEIPVIDLRFNHI